MKNTNKNDFITAYQCTFGTTKKEAAKTYKECIRDGKTGYISAIIEGFKMQVKANFNND